MQIGYARVSTSDQTAALQLDALKRAGCDQIFCEEPISGAIAKRPVLDKALKKLNQGDVLIVWKLDRLGRSLSHLIAIANDLARRKIGFRSVSEAIDTTTAQGRLVFHVMGALAEFERALIIERTCAGLEAAKKRGVKMGRKPKLTREQINHASKLLKAGERAEDVAGSLRVSRATVYRAVQKQAA